jgi:hypothetical protein
MREPLKWGSAEEGDKKVRSEVGEEGTNGGLAAPIELEFSV